MTSQRKCNKHRGSKLWPWEISWHGREIQPNIRSQPQRYLEVSSDLRTSITCYRCRGQGHMTRDCTTRRPDWTNTPRSRQKMRCFKCNKIGHFSSEWQGNSSWEKDFSASLFPKQVKHEEHPLIPVPVDGRQCTALVDTNYSKTCIGKFLCRRWRGQNIEVLTADRNIFRSNGIIQVELAVGYEGSLHIEIVVVEGKPLGFDLVLGFDDIKNLGSAPDWMLWSLLLRGELTQVWYDQDQRTRLQPCTRPAEEGMSRLLQMGRWSDAGVTKTLSHGLP